MHEITKLLLRPFLNKYINIFKTLYYLNIVCLNGQNLFNKNYVCFV